MKIPETAPGWRREQIVADFRVASRKYTAEYGIYIATLVIFRGSKKIDSEAERVYFSVMEHEFEGIRDLRKALRLKAFI